MLTVFNFAAPPGQRGQLLHHTVYIHFRSHLRRLHVAQHNHRSRDMEATSCTGHSRSLQVQKVWWGFVNDRDKGDRRDQHELKYSQSLQQNLERWIEKFCCLIKSGRLHRPTATVHRTAPQRPPTTTDENVQSHHVPHVSVHHVPASKLDFYALQA